MADISLNAPQNVPLPVVIADRDIVFACPACAGELVVDRDGAGMEVPCPHCGLGLTIPEYQTPEQSLPIPEGLVGGIRHPSSPPPTRTFDFSDQTPEQLERRSGDLKHQLKENRSQDTEMRGHVNRATMELHRLQLRLKKLQERQVDIEAELAALEAFGKADG